MKKFLKISLVITICLSIVASITVSAVSTKFAPYQGYEYNSYKESTAAPIGYTASATKTGEDFNFMVEIESFTDIAQDPHDSDNASMFILDGKSGVVYKTDESLDVKAVFDNFTNKGKVVNLKGSKYIACDYDNAYFYVYNNDKIYVINSLSEITKTINAPGIKGMSFYRTIDGADYLVTVGGDGKEGTVSFYSPAGKLEKSFAVGKSLNALHADYEGALLIVDGAADVNMVFSYNLGFDAEGKEALVMASEPYGMGIDLSTVVDVATASFGAVHYLTKSDGGVYKVDMGTITVLNDSTVPHNVDVPSMEFTSIIHTSSTTKELLYALGNKKGPHIVSFNSEGGYVDSIDTLDISFSSPSDMLYKGEYVYVLDSGNSRIVKFDKDLTEIVDIFANFYNEKTDKYVSFYGAQGFTVDDDENFYITATEQYKVYKMDNKGYVQLVINKPEEQLADQKDTPFRATKVLLDRKGLIYVICDSINLGAFVFNQEGEFESFFGANTVQATADVLLNYIRRRFMTREQLKGLKRSTPITLTNFDIDKDGFVYTVTEADQSKRNSDFTNMIRKLNYQGDNIFESSEASFAGFGDYEWDRQSGKITNTSFCDVDIDEEGYINLIDSGRGKVFQYSEDGDLITVFGGHSNQVGTFDEPVAIESVGEQIYVLDKESNSVTIFDPTPYTLQLRKAYALLDSSDADAALKEWRNVLKYNTNSRFPYYGMGRAYEMKGEYELAMENFKLAHAKAEYSKAFKEYRKDYVAGNIWWMGLIAIAAIVAIIIAVKILKKHLVAKHGEAYSPLETKAGMPLYVLMHPVDGFEQFRNRGVQSIPMAFGIVICWFLVNVLKFFNTGFAFNANRAIDYDLVANLISTVALFVLFVISNWAVCTLLNGKGRMREIICVTAYALTPIIITSLVSIVLSNSLTLDEGAFISILGTVGTLWAAIILLLGLYTIHQYSFGGTIGSVILTVLGMAIMALLIILFFTLLQQCYSFIYSVYSELKLR